MVITQRYFFLSLLVFLAGSIRAQDLLRQRVDLIVDEVHIIDALHQLIEQNKHISITFSDDAIPDAQVSVVMRGRPLSTTLASLLAGTNLHFRQIGQQVVIYREERPRDDEKKSHYTISGYVEDIDSGERLITASVYDRYSGKGTMTNNYGFFSLTLPAGPIDLQWSYLGYTPRGLRMELWSDRRLVLSLRTALMLEEVIVVAADTSPLSLKEGFVVDNVSAEQAGRFPSLAGEADLIRQTHLLPGVQTGAEGMGGIFVRGGDAGHNLVLFDGAPVYNMFHAGGLFSVVNPNAVNSAKMLRGVFPARYGGRLASVLDIRTREGNNRIWRGQAEAGLLSANAMIEGPLAPDRGAILAAARVSYLNWYLRPLSSQYKAERGIDGAAGYQFHDINLKANYALSPNDHLYFSVYQGRDGYDNTGLGLQTIDIYNPLAEDTLRFRYGQRFTERLSWGNTAAALRWNRIFSPKFFANALLTYSRLETQFNYSHLDSLARLAPQPQLLGQSLVLGVYLSSIADGGAKIDFDYVPSTKHYLRFGAAANIRRFEPGLVQIDAADVGGLTLKPVRRIRQSKEYVAYLEDDWRLGERIRLNLGFRLAMMDVGARHHYGWEPRMAVFWRIDPRWAFRASAGLNTQFLHLLSSSHFGLPTDMWAPSTEHIEPQRSWELAAGVHRELGGGFTLDMDAYFKGMRNLLTYTEGAFFLNDWERNVTAGDGKAYGLEMALRKSAGKTSGWIAYSLAWADRRFDLVNNGARFPFRYDRRHDLKIAARHRLGQRLELHAAWLFGAGLAFSLPQQRYDFKLPGLPNDPIPVVVYSGKNQDRMPPYHRLDLGMSANLPSKRLQHTVNAGVYNLYNRKNPLYFDIRTRLVNQGGQLTESKEYVKVWIAPMLPYLNYSVKF
jgi:hypothetical protein